MEMMGDTIVSLPLWANIMISLLGAFSGLELLKFLYDIIFNRKSNKQKNNAEADQITAEANSADVDYRQKEMELLAMQTEFNKQQFENLKNEYAELSEQRNELKDSYNTINYNYKLLKNNYIDLVRKVDGLQKAFTTAFATEVQKKKDAEAVCCFKDCLQREPKKGTFSTDTTDINSIMTKPKDLISNVEEI